MFPSIVYRSCFSHSFTLAFPLLSPSSSSLFLLILRRWSLSRSTSLNQEFKKRDDFNSSCWCSSSLVEFSVLYFPFRECRCFTKSINEERTSWDQRQERKGSRMFTRTNVQEGRQEDKEFGAEEVLANVLILKKWGRGIKKLLASFFLFLFSILQTLRRHTRDHGNLSCISSIDEVDTWHSHFQLQKHSLLSRQLQLTWKLLSLSVLTHVCEK